MKKSYILAAAFAAVAILAVFAIFKQGTSVRKGEQTDQISPNITTSENLQPTIGGKTNNATAGTGEASTLTLEVTTPKDQTTVTTAQVTVKGKTAPQAEVTVNDQDLKADSKGNFTVTVLLDEGENYISVTVNDAEGNYAEKELTVTYAPSN